MQKYRLLLVLLMVLSQFDLGALSTKAADSLNGNDIDESISKLEDKFFEHRYDNEPEIDRLNRLEEFVYGSAGSGSDSQRVQNLLSTIASQESVPTEESTNNRNDSGSSQNISNNSRDNSNGQADKSSSNNSANSSSSDDSDSDSSRNAFDYSSYPRVSNLEQELLGRAYPNDSLNNRIVRLETKAYGAPSTSSDLSQRVDLLDDYAERHDLYGDHRSTNQIASNDTDDKPAFAPLPRTYGTPPVSTNNNGLGTHRFPAPSEESQPAYTGSGSFVGSAEERVSMMEAQVFHHTYPDKSLQQRLSKLQKKIMPNERIDMLSETAQTVKLWDTLHPDEKNQVASLAANINEVESTPVNSTSTSRTTQSSSDADTSNSSNTPSSKHGSWLHKLASSAGAFGGSGYGGYGNSSNYTSSSYNTPAPSAPGMPYYGPGMPGYGNSRFVGASVGPGAGPFGIPVNFW